MARVFSSGSSYRVAFGPQAVEAFRGKWPASGLDKLRRVSFEFDRRSGDLVDTACNSKHGSCERFDGPALLALSQNAQCVAEKRLRPRPEHAPRCEKSLGSGTGKTRKAVAPACRTALSSCMKTRRTQAGGPKACMIAFNACRR